MRALAYDDADDDDGVTLYPARVPIVAPGALLLSAL